MLSFCLTIHNVLIDVELYFFFQKKLILLYIILISCLYLLIIRHIYCGINEANYGLCMCEWSYYKMYM